MNTKTIFITGSTGVMGYATLKEFENRLDRFNLRLLVRPSKKNKKKLAKYLNHPAVTIIWGDLTNPDDVKRALGDSDIVLHIGGMVSPAADYYPHKTLKVNINAMKNVVEAVKSHPRRDEIGVVYIGSVAETSDRTAPLHWGRIGDPVHSSPYDYYGISKIEAERILLESRLNKWVSLRQSGILHAGLLYNANDPISMHVPLNEVLEWSTVEDSGRLMANLCEDNVPDSFWNNVYNIGSGENFRITNYEFMELLMNAIGCPGPKKSFETYWFATRNFHGQWYVDSDKLNEIVPFREDISVQDYFKRMATGIPFYFKMAKLAPASLIKMFMKRVAYTKDYGTLDWDRRTDCEGRIKAYFGSREQRNQIPDWDQLDLTPPSKIPILLDHGYDESKPDCELNIEDMKQAAKFRGGKCLSESMTPGDLYTPLEWVCARGHKFTATPFTVLKAGHWCPDCMPAPWKYDEEAKLNPFLAQIWYASHSSEENNVYE